MYKVSFENNNTVISNLDFFDPSLTFCCGQCFRWEKVSTTHWSGIAHGRLMEIICQDGKLTLIGTSKAEFESIWRHYFDLGRDYKNIQTAALTDKTLGEMAAFGSGIRLLNQEPFETLISFIISQNNNIPRIKGIIERLCAAFGEDIGGGKFAFPTAQQLCGKSLDDLSVLRAGFRAKYILDAAQKIASGEIILESLINMPADDARQQLIKIKGVGEKVADCVLLFSLCHPEVFPKDVWIKRAMPILFPDGLPEFTLPYAGIIQQYIFHFARTTKIR